MLYICDCDSNKADKIIIRVLGDVVTEQQYLVGGNVVERETYTWEVDNKILRKCYGPKGSTLIVPPTVGADYDLKSIDTNAFSEVQPSQVVVLGINRLTLRPGAFNFVNSAKVYSCLKRSEIPDNVQALGRILEDV